MAKTTFIYHHPDLEAVVGDEKQADFYPRLKLKKWNNEVNFSVGLAHTAGSHAVNGDQIDFSGAHDASFYPTATTLAPATQINFQNLGAISPERIGSIYELNRYFPEDQLTISLHWADRYSMMYYGFYDRDSYIDPAKLDLPEMRVSAYPLQNGPMVMDESLKLVDVRYSELRDDTDKIHASTLRAVTQNVQKYGIEVIYHDGGKLYFKDGDKEVKFFSTAFVGGHYYYYVNLGLDYNKSHDYYRDDVTPNTRDTYAYGLRAVNPDIPDTIVNDIVSDFAELYELPLVEQTYSAPEQTKLAALDTIHTSRNWIEQAERDDCYDTIAPNVQANDGFEFAITLTSQPDSNQIPLSLQSKNLKFHYQGELSTEEKVVKNRPQNVIDSWAVYHAQKKDNEYQTGKAFHIWRLWAQDANGGRVWCSLKLDVDEAGNLLSNDAHIELPQDFLDSAVYPVLIDPTFGYTTQGASAQISNGTTAYGLPATPSATGALKKMTAFVTQASSPPGVKVALYQASNSAKVVGSNENTSAVNPGAWLDFTLTSNPTVTPISYNLVYAQSGGSYNAIACDTVTNGGVQAAYTYAAGNDGFPSSLSFTTNNDKISIYGTYTAVIASDSISTAENIQLLLGINTTASDNLSVSEAVHSELNSFINQSDSTSISESVKTATTTSVAVSDSITTSESVAILLPLLLVSLADSSSISESVRLGITATATDLIIDNEPLQNMVRGVKIV